MLVVSNKDYGNQRQGDDKVPLEINTPFYYGGVPRGMNITHLEVKTILFT